MIQTTVFKKYSQTFKNMKKSLQTILQAAFIISTIGVIMDSDVKEASVLLRFFEFFMMTLTIFALLSTAYFTIKFFKSKFQTIQKV